MTQIERIDKKILCLNMRIEGDKRSIDAYDKMKGVMVDNAIIKKKPDVVLLAMSIMSERSTDQILSQNRKGTLVMCRMIIVHRLSVAGMGPTRIGKILERDHSTIIHLREQFKIDVTRDVIRNMYDQFEAVLDKLLTTHRG